MRACAVPRYLLFGLFFLLLSAHALAWWAFKHFLVEVPISNEQISEARRLLSSVKGTHIKDVMHAILARDNCAVMITRDKHFDALVHFVEVAKPEDIHF